MTYRQQCVVVDGVKSPYQSCFAGVPQGSILGPLLFTIMYINILPDVCSDINAQMFADDVVISFTHRATIDIAIKLTNALKTLQGWLSENSLVLNINKTTWMIFTKDQQKINSWLH